MGCGTSSPEFLAQVEQNKKIQVELNEQRRAMQRETKLLLLGKFPCTSPSLFLGLAKGIVRVKCLHLPPLSSSLFLVFCFFLVVSFFRKRGSREGR